MYVHRWCNTATECRSGITVSKEIHPRQWFQHTSFMNVITTSVCHISNVALFSNQWFPRINAITSKNGRYTSFHFTSPPPLLPTFRSNQYPEALWLNGLNPHMFTQVDRTYFISTLLIFSPHFARSLDGLI